MKSLGVLFLLAAQTLQFDVTDSRGKPTSSFTIEAGAPDEDGWHSLKVTKGKGEPVLIWPFDSLAKLPDGPEPVPAIVIQRGDEKVLTNKKALAALATSFVLGRTILEDVAHQTGLAPDALVKALAALVSSTDPFEKGVGLLYAGKADAAEPLAVALKQRQRQLTRVPSEIYAVAMLYGQALYRANKFDESAVAFLTALKQRPSDEAAGKYRSEALVKAGKPDAAAR